MRILRLYLSGDGPAFDCPWSLLDSEGRMQAMGTVEDVWPAHDEIELILPAGRTRFCCVELPPGAHMQSGVVLGFALEDSLINDPAENAYAIGPQREGNDYAVALTAVGLLERAQAWLKTRGTTAERILPEEMLLPLPSQGGWSLARARDGLIVRQEPAHARFVPDGAPELLDALCAAGLPLGVTLYGAPLPHVLNRVASQVAPAYDWRCAKSSTVLNFAHGALAGRKSLLQWKMALRRLSYAVLLVLLAEGSLSLIEVGWLSWQRFSLERTIVAQARQFELSALDAPHQMNAPQALRQMSARLERARRKHGLPSPGDALELMAALERVAGSELHPLVFDYRNGQLRFNSDAPSDALEHWRLRLAWHQLRLERDAAAGQMVLALRS